MGFSKREKLRGFLIAQPALYKNLNMKRSASHHELNGQNQYRWWTKNKAKDYGILLNFQPYLAGQDIVRRFHDDTYAYVNKCFYPWYAFRVNPYGDVYPCSMDILIGNIKEQSIKTLWNNEKYVSFRKALMKKGIFPRCTKCCVLNNTLWSYLPCVIKS